MRIFSVAALAVLTFGCGKEATDETPEQKEPEPICEIRTRGKPHLDMYLFPTVEAAKEFDNAIRIDDPVRANLAVAAPGVHRVPGGSKCELRNIEGDYALVYAVDQKAGGWVWYNDVRRDPREP